MNHAFIYESKGIAMYMFSLKSPSHDIVYKPFNQGVIIVNVTLVSNQMNF